VAAPVVCVVTEAIAAAAWTQSLATGRLQRMDDRQGHYPKA
jgi:hypothetical protein